MSKYLISLILLSVISMGVSAQRITRQYNNVSFSAALKDLNAKQDKYVINFVYDELEDFKVTKNIKNESVPDSENIGRQNLRQLCVSATAQSFKYSSFGLISDTDNGFRCIKG